MPQEIQEITRADLARIAGEEFIAEAESMPESEFQQQKWSRLAELVQNYSQFDRLTLFEARRSFLLSLDPSMRRLLVRHIFDEWNHSDF
jgi:hypothetical protein